MTNKRKQLSLWYLAPVGILALILTITSHTALLHHPELVREMMVQIRRMATPNRKSNEEAENAGNGA